MSGLFISFEGVDGCGKSTQMQKTAQYLEERGLKPLLTREPGGCNISESVRDILLNPRNTNMDPWAEMLLYAAARAQHVAEVIRPAISAGRIVLSDRYLDSSFAYQGYGRKLGHDAVMRANEAALDTMPDITFFLDVPPDAGFGRKRIRGETDRLEQSGDEFYRRVYSGFLKIAERYPERIVRVDALGSVNETQAQIRWALDRLLCEKGL